MHNNTYTHLILHQSSYWKAVDLQDTVTDMDGIPNLRANQHPTYPEGGGISLSATTHTWMCASVWTDYLSHWLGRFLINYHNSTMTNPQAVVKILKDAWQIIPRQFVIKSNSMGGKKTRIAEKQDGRSSKVPWAWPQTNNYTYATYYSVFTSVCQGQEPKQCCG